MYSVLVIDDQDYKIQDIKKQLNDDCVNCDSAMESYEARDKIEENQYDLILLDMTMNGLWSDKDFAGIEILNFLEELDVTIPVIVVTQFFNFKDCIINKEQKGFFKINTFFGNEPSYNISKDLDVYQLPNLHEYLSQNYKNYYGCVLYIQNDMVWIDNLQEMLFELGGKQYENFITRR